MGRSFLRTVTVMLDLAEGMNGTVMGNQAGRKSGKFTCDSQKMIFPLGPVRCATYCNEAKLFCFCTPGVGREVLVMMKRTPCGESESLARTTSLAKIARLPVRMKDSQPNRGGRSDPKQPSHPVKAPTLKRRGWRKMTSE